MLRKQVDLLYRRNTNKHGRLLSKQVEMNSIKEELIHLHEFIKVWRELGKVIVDLTVM